MGSKANDRGLAKVFQSIYRRGPEVFRIIDLSVVLIDRLVGPTIRAAEQKFLERAKVKVRYQLSPAGWLEEASKSFGLGDHRRKYEVSFRLMCAWETKHGDSNVRELSSLGTCFLGDRISLTGSHAAISHDAKRIPANEELLESKPVISAVALLTQARASHLFATMRVSSDSAAANATRT